MSVLAIHYVALVRCWAIVCDTGPEFGRHWVGVSCVHSGLYSRAPNGLPVLIHIPFQLIWSIQHCNHFRATHIHASADGAGPTFNRHWVGVNMYSVDT